MRRGRDRGGARGRESQANPPSTEAQGELDLVTPRS